MKNRYVQSTKNYLIKFSDFYIDLKPAWNRMHTVLATQGLKRNVSHIYDNGILVA